MPVQSSSDWEIGLSLDFPFLDDGSVPDDLFANPPFDDMWNKFELEPLTDQEWWGDDWLEVMTNGDGGGGPDPQIRVHDCMWAGTCLSKAHVGLKAGAAPVAAAATTVSKPAAPVTVARPAAASTPPKYPAPPRPDTPQSLSESEDESKKETRCVSVSEVTNQRRTDQHRHHHHQQILVLQPPAINAQFDHNYDTKHPRLEDLGVQTPSDSEEEEEESTDSDESQEDDEDEEIDVVSLKPASPPPPAPTAPGRRGGSWDGSEDTARLVRWASMAVSRKLGKEEKRSGFAAPNNTTASSTASTTTVTPHRPGPGRKRKRASSDEDETYRPHQGRRQWRKLSATPSKKCRTSTDSETDSTEKRSQHNNMERMRRIDQRNALEDLRSLVPSLADAPRAAKVTILRDAASYCTQLTSNAKTLSSQVSILRKEQEKLKTHLSKLRRLVAMKYLR